MLVIPPAVRTVPFWSNVADDPSRATRRLPPDENAPATSSYNSIAALLTSPPATSTFPVGSSTADEGTRDPHTIRLFDEGVPTSETAQQGAIRRAIGGEVDGPSRQLGRFVEFSVFGADTTVDWSIIGDRKELDVRGAHLGPYCYPIAIDLLGTLWTLPASGSRPNM